MDKNYIVKKSNYFIMNSSYDLSLEEQKLVLTLASMVQPEDEDFKPYKFRINEFMQLLGVDTKTKYTVIPNITKELMKKVFEIEEDDTIIQTAWLSSAIYKKGSGMVELEFSPRLKPYMVKLNTMFTQYKLANILSMKSKYSPRIYEILKCNEFKKQGYIEMEVEELRKLLKADNIYPLYADFKRNVLLQTQKELKKLTDISFEFEEIKTGRRVTTLKIYIISNTKKKIEAKPIEYAEDEIAATNSKNINSKIFDGIDKIVNLMAAQNITPYEAIKIFKSAEGDMDHIAKVYSYCKDKSTNNFVGYIIKMVKPGEFVEPKKNFKKSHFKDYEQRNYDFDELERKLLGWD